MKDKALRTIAEHRMIERGDNVVAGFSGGADSVALLHFLRYNSGALGIKNLTACHVNHNLRGEESMRDELFARSFCKEHGIELRVVSLDIPALARKSGKSVELCAREQRYLAFNALCQELGEAKIATAHTLSDSIETALLNFARGTGLRGISGIPPVRGNIVRPLIACSRMEIEQYCESTGLSYVDDSSNESHEYTRNRIRHTVIPGLHTVNESLERNMYDAMRSFAQDNSFIESCAVSALERARAKGGYSCELLLSENPAVLHRAVILLMREHGVEPHRRRVELVEELMAQGGALELSAGLYFEVRGKALHIKRPQERRKYFEKPFSEGITELFEGKALKILLWDCEQYNKFKKNSPDVLKNVLDYDRIGGNAVLRQRLPADAIRLAGRGCTKSLKKLFNENSIPVEKRPDIVIASDIEGVFWVEGMGIAQRVMPDEKTVRFCVIWEYLRQGNESNEY